MCGLGCCISSPRTNSDLKERFIERSEVMFGSPCRWEMPVMAMETTRRWSGNLDMRYRYGSPGKRRHGRTKSMGVSSLVGVEGEPKLVRSTGMRRDWSFTDLQAADRDGRQEKWDAKSSC